MLASKLNMSRDDAERWIVNLIRNAKLDAKIDAKEVNYCVTPPRTILFNCFFLSIFFPGSCDHEHTTSVFLPASDRQD